MPSYFGYEGILCILCMMYLVPLTFDFTFWHFKGQTAHEINAFKNNKTMIMIEVCQIDIFFLIVNTM